MMQATLFYRTGEKRNIFFRGDAEPESVEPNGKAGQIFYLTNMERLEYGEGYRPGEWPRGTGVRGWPRPVSVP